MKYKITVFTPTYNRLNLLKRLYQSLLAQTEKAFEWIIIDDESTDGTDNWIDTVISNSPFPIKYEKQKHGGKHRAINKGVVISDCEYFFIVDSDDWLPDNAIEIVLSWIGELGDSKKIAAVAGICINPNNQTIGGVGKLENNKYVEVNNLKRYCNHLMGDKAEVYKTDLLRKFPFPEYEDEYFVTERLIWDRIADAGYTIRWYNTPIYIAEYQAGGLSNSGANQTEGHLNNYNGYLEFIKQSIKIMDPLEAVSYFREYNKVACLKKKSLRVRANEIGLNTAYYCYYLCLKMPIYYIGRIILKIRLRLQEMNMLL
ncbi:glycosyltransferase family A protein [Pseudobutyrivibrio ruminis]|uniref:Glycosyl transferase family 2 n=1 Tax=Pseudobutyrivibrio ruminis DSM 9787 TaxID=1123011 RepID=A0A285S919_9FIRM|nr:glycosyltransferase family A protein [Pseudobutyrivibrio ruminis]SOC03967.1 Glycosyl transferase family 2 [Pseudobutyrivibrio ruminis DSM 9787]